MIRLENITLAFDSKVLLQGAACHFAAGTLTALVGRNGAGKSSLLRILAAIDTPTAGDVLVGGKALRDIPTEKRAKAISFVSTQRVRVANLLCRDVVATGRAPYTNWIGRISSEDREIISQSLSAVGMEAFANRAIDTLSDGEFQRVMIARALAQQTPIILLDEPTAFLDIPTRFEICRLLADLAHNSGKTIIFSTHDIDAAMPVCDAFAILDNAAITMCDQQSAKEQIKRLFSL
jgi:iron complex transport system ATP-binding protein